MVLVSTQLQCCESKECKHQRSDPEAHDDLALAPAQQFKVVVDGSHLEDALLAQLVRSNLEDDRERLNHEYPTDKRQQQFLFNEYSDSSDCPAKCQRTDIPHKHFCRMRVVPEKADSRADHGPAKNGQLRNLRNFRNFKVIGENGVAADVGEDG